LAIIAVVPAVIAGSFILLQVTGHSLNIQSFMGCIMAIGVAVANAILLVTRAEALRKEPAAGNNLGLEASKYRLRPILMTTLAMMAGMLPMAIGFGEGGSQTAPLGIAVIGGLFFSSFATLLILPMIYNAFAGKKKFISPSLDPEDRSSKYYEHHEKN
jgi:multidrug efflux pump subunit AcrB